MNRAICNSSAVILLGVLTLCLPRSLAAMDVDAEFDFASRLIEFGFPDLANRVVGEVLRSNPDEQDRATRIQGEILVAQRRFADAEELVKSMPEGHTQRYALQLRIANGYFRAGNVEDARRLYDEFFAVYRDRTPTEPDLLRFYQDASYQYGQMLERLGNRAAAAEAYHRLLRAGVEEASAQRRLQMDLARLYLQLGRESSGEEKTDFLNKAYAMCEEVQWGGYDLWFGQSISLMAHVELVRGNEAAARELLSGYMSDLNRLDRILREQNFPAALSPVANARFLLGELHEKRVQALRAQNAPESEILQAIQSALTEYYNVFGQYGGSEWGGEARTRGMALVRMLNEEYGRRVNVDFGEHGAEAAQAQFTQADDVFRQRDYERAVKEYLLILNQFPESEPSMRALANLLMSYVHLEDDLHVRMLVSYIAERFSGEELLGTALLMAGRTYVERRDEEMFTAIFEQFFEGFPQHERAPQLMFDMARRRETAGDIEGAMTYYKRIVENYPRDRFFLRSLFAMAVSLHQRGEYAEVVPYLIRYVEEATPGQDRVRAQFLLADSYQRQSDFQKAIGAYRQILTWMQGDNPPDNARSEDVEPNRLMTERALFFIAYCFGRIEAPAEHRAALRDRGVTFYREFLRLYPDSELAPRAMRDMGAYLLALEQSAEAAQVFEQLAERYPDSDEGRSALFALVSSAFEIGEVQIARDAFQRMISMPDIYSPEEFARIGQLMLDNQLYEDVIPAYRQVVESTQERRMLELALFGLGSAYYQQGKYADSVAALDDLLERFPNSAYFYDAKFLLAKANRALPDFDAAHAALVDILRLSQDNIVNQRAQFELGLLQKDRGELLAALASFQRIALLQDPADQQLRPIIEDSLIESLKLMMELERYSDVAAVAAQFTADFSTSPRMDEVRQIRDEARRLAGGA